MVKSSYKIYFKDNIKANENDAVRIFPPIKNRKLNTGFEVKVRKPKVINQLKEDKQTFGLLVVYYLVYSYPLTTDIK